MRASGGGGGGGGRAHQASTTRIGGNGRRAGGVWFGDSIHDLEGATATSTSMVPGRGFLVMRFVKSVCWKGGGGPGGQAREGGASRTRNRKKGLFITSTPADETRTPAAALAPARKDEGEMMEVVVVVVAHCWLGMKPWLGQILEQRGNRGREGVEVGAHQALFGGVF